VFYGNEHQHRIQPPPLPDITRGTTLKVLGVMFTNTMSASDHVRHVISDSAQSLYALRVLRHHGLGEAGLQTVFRAVVVSRLAYAASAWFGFITSTDKQRIEAFFRLKMGISHENHSQLVPKSTRPLPTYPQANLTMPPTLSPSPKLNPNPNFNPCRNI